MPWARNTASQILEPADPFVRAIRSIDPNAEIWAMWSKACGRDVIEMLNAMGFIVFGNTENFRAVRSDMSSIYPNMNDRIVAAAKDLSWEMIDIFV